MNKRNFIKASVLSAFAIITKSAAAIIKPFQPPAIDCDVEIRQGPNVKWKRSSMSKLKRGDVFIMVSSEPVEITSPHYLLHMFPSVAKSNPYVTNGVWSIRISPMYTWLIDEAPQDRRLAADQRATDETVTQP